MVLSFLLADIATARGYGTGQASKPGMRASITIIVQHAGDHGGAAHGWPAPGGQSCLGDLQHGSVSINSPPQSKTIAFGRQLCGELGAHRTTSLGGQDGGHLASVAGRDGRQAERGYRGGPVLANFLLDGAQRCLAITVAPSAAGRLPDDAQQIP